MDALLQVPFGHAIAHNPSVARDNAIAAHPRRAALDQDAAIGRLMAQTGLSAAAIDWFFFQNRTRCPETQDPDCSACPVQALCARETGLFQRVFRTTAY